MKEFSWVGTDLNPQQLQPANFFSGNCHKIGKDNDIQIVIAKETEYNMAILYNFSAKERILSWPINYDIWMSYNKVENVQK